MWVLSERMTLQAGIEPAAWHICDICDIIDICDMCDSRGSREIRDRRSCKLQKRKENQNALGYPNGD